MTEPEEKLPTWPEEALSELEKDSPVPEFTLKGHHTKLEQQVADFLDACMESTYIFRHIYRFLWRWVSRYLNV